MKGDFSRDTFDPAKHYSGVLMQQGRVQTDADWNEQLAIARHHHESALLDMIGSCGGPAALSGFRISIKGGETLTIGPGRYYVDGLLCENDMEVPLEEQPHPPGPIDVAKAMANSNLALVYLDVWEQHVTALDDASIREVALGGPDTATRIKTIWQVRLMPIDFARGDPRALERLHKERNAIKDKLARLTPDRTSAGRRKQLEAELNKINSAIAALADRPPPPCEAAFPEWDALVARSTGMLRARTTPPLPEKNLCTLPPTAGYQRLENQLYRVEIHAAGKVPGNATFKWSRENGSVVTTVTDMQTAAKRLVVRDLGRDEVLGFAPGQWVELTDDTHELRGIPGALLQIASVDAVNRTITVAQSLPPVDLKQRARLRRWDQTGPGATSDGVTIKDALAFVPLEGGIEVAFSQNDYRTGEYWLIPARTATSEIEWPQSEPPKPEQLPRLPLGIQHHYCRLALLHLDEDGKTLAVQDCRRTFSPLPEQARAVHVLGTNWLNDDEMTLDDFIKNGLQVTLDAIPGSLTVPEAGVVVVFEPIEKNGQLPPTAEMTVLRGHVNVVPNGMHWRPNMTLDQLEKLFDAIGVMGARVTLKGHVIWSEADCRLYLDGQVFGQPGLRADKKTPRTALLFPSGAGDRASDFESWFELARPPRVKTVTFNPPQASVGKPTEGTVTLTRRAPALGVLVTLQSSNPPAVSVPPEVQIAAGNSSAPFTVTAIAKGEVTITATLSGLGREAKLQVT